jgi:LPXTG-motif cell wall-anchored protein
MGPSYYSDVLPGPAMVSLGEVAAKLKAAKGAVNARMLTNDDIGKMVGSQTGVTLTKNMPPLGSSVAGLMAPQAAQAGPQQGGQPPQDNPVSQAGTPPPAPGAQQAQPQAPNAANATTPEVNQPQTHDTQGASRLPATSTWLPLLGILGAMSGAAGLWFRRLRK